MSSLRWSLLLALVACASAPADDTDTDTDETDETDTSPPDLDASGWEIHPTAPQTYEATLVAGENRAPADFVAKGELSHTIVEFQGADFRNFIGEVVRDNPLGNTPPEDEQETGAINCRGPGLYGITLALVAVQDEQSLPIRVFTTARIDPEDKTKPCTMNIEQHTFQRFTATISEAVLLDSDVDGDQKEITLEDISIDLVLREAVAE
jgi:hypothetical protein